MKIGFFDSGMGGLFMMQSCSETYPNHNYIYVGDTQNLPYGPRKSQEILGLMSPYLLWLLEVKKCDYVLVACNTASAQALESFINVYPKYSEKIMNIVHLTQNYLQANIPQTKTLLVLATKRTVESQVYQKNGTEQLAMPGLVDLIELGDRKGAFAMLTNALSYYPEINYVLLACTHYVALFETLKNFYPEIQFITQDSIIQSWIKDLPSKERSQESE